MESQGAVVETNSIIRKDYMSPVYGGRLPYPVHNLVIKQVINQENVLKAAIEMDKEKAFNAFLNDPLVTIDIDNSRELFNKMLENTKEYLDGWDI